ncbi:MAG TPA: DUF72 domain-containing protein [Mucilaginibacter sp.]|nr:DUF72 domain-containing protein [Mucilaginibacter sp.]
MENSFYAGTSGLVLPIPQRDFEPQFKQLTRLAYYGRLLNSIEINSSFYKLPMQVTVAKWTASVPDNFKFTFKLWRQVTHQRNLNFTDADVDSFMKVIANASGREGCILIQLPPSTDVSCKAKLFDLVGLIKGYNSDGRWKIAVEFRHKSWYSDTVVDMLSKSDAGMVIHDMPASAAPHQLTAESFVYLRFHGPAGDYKGSYSDDFLNEYAEYINEWRDDGKQVFVYFNNTVGDAWNNLITLQRYVAAR